MTTVYRCKRCGTMAAPHQIEAGDDFLPTEECGCYMGADWVRGVWIEGEYEAALAEARKERACRGCGKRLVDHPPGPPCPPTPTPWLARAERAERELAELKESLPSSWEEEESYVQGLEAEVRRLRTLLHGSDEPLSL